MEEWEGGGEGGVRGAKGKGSDWEKITKGREGNERTTVEGVEDRLKQKGIEKGTEKDGK